MSTTTTKPASSTQHLPKWHTIYANDKECRFFRELSRGQYEWRTSDSLAKKANLTVKEIEHILAKYLPIGVVQQHSKEPGKFRYWERATTKKKAKGSISAEDQKQRVKDATKKSP